jgi:xanthine dehydrogenase accessory factor
MNRELVELAAELSRRHEPFLVATVVWARGPSSGKRGSAAIIRPGGEVIGWIGGACAKPVVLREAQEAMADGQPRLLMLGTEEDIAQVGRPGVITVPISCTSEGALEVFLEPMLPQPHLVVIGESPAVTTMLELAATLGWPADLMDQIDFDRRTWVVILSHATRHETPVLEAALKTEARYIGAMGSRRTHNLRVERLKGMGFNDEDVARIHGPVGLDIGAESPQEVAVSILAEMTLVRYGAGTGLSLHGVEGRIHKQRPEDA